MTRRSPLAQSEQARRLRDHAELAIWADAFDEAFEHADAALRLDPADAPARLIQARVQLQRSRPQEALRSLDAHDQFGLNADTHASAAAASRLRAASLARNGQPALAIRQVEALLETNPADLSLLRMLGALQLRDGRDAEAIETFTLLRELAPDDGVVARTLSDLLADHAPSRSAEVLGPREASNALRQARLLAKSGRCVEADTAYRALLDEHDQETWLWLEAATLAMRTGELNSAEERLMNALATAEPFDQPDEATRKAWSKLAIQAIRRGRVTQAGWAWWRAIRALPAPCPEAWAGLLTCATLADRPGLMRRADRRLRSLTTRSQRRALLAERWLDAANTAYADPAVAGTLRPADAASPLSALLDHAAEALDAQATRFPGRADVRLHRARVHEAQGHDEAALEEATVALSINPQYADAAMLCDRLAA